jgi:hypothetical protein
MPARGVNLWGESPLHVNPGPSQMMMTEILPEGKSKIRDFDRGAEP